MKSLDEYDCDEERRRALALTFYSQGMGKGKIVSSEDFGNDKPAWSYVIPGSVAATALSMFCQSR